MIVVEDWLIPLLLAIKEEMLPIPLAPIPIRGLGLDQEIFVEFPEKLIFPVFVLLQTTTFGGWLTTGIGRTVIIVL